MNLPTELKSEEKGDACLFWATRIAEGDPLLLLWVMKTDFPSKNV